VTDLVGPPYSGFVKGQPQLSAGSIFAADFRIERALARGGMGAVYVAHQLSTGRERALKLMHPMLAEDLGMRRRFEQEAKIGARIRSNHIVEVIGAGIDEATGVPWLAMELLEGEDLAAYVARRGALPAVEVEQILGQLCHALGAAHAVNVVHRDLKPENVFLSRAHQQGAPTIVKLLDLGIAKLVADAHPRDTAAVGTPLWMAPEQTGGTVGPQADVWAIGLLAFFMLTGRCYWRGAGNDGEQTSVMKVLREVVVDPLDPASVRATNLGCIAELPAGFDAWFTRCVAREPSERFADAVQAELGFKRLIHGTAETLLAPDLPRLSPAQEPSREPTGAQGTTDRGAALTLKEAPRRNLTPLVGVAALLLLSAGVLALAARSPRPTAATASSVAAVAAAAVSVSATAAPPAAPSAAVVPRAPANLDDPNLVWKIPVGDSPQRGSADAVVTIVEFANYQCPFSKGVEPHLRRLLDKYPGKLRVVWKDDPLALHSQAEVSAAVAREARSQKGDAGFWAAHDHFLDPSFKPSVKTLLAAAKELALDVPSVEKVIAERPYRAAIAADADLADDFAVVGTPSFFVNGKRVAISPNLDKIEAAVAAELERTAALVASGTPPAKVYESIIADGHGGVPLELKSFPGMAQTVPSRGAPQSLVTLVQFCDFGNFLCKLVDSNVEELLRAFPEQLGVLWIDVPDAKSEDSRRASLAARSAYRHGGVEGFDRMRRLLFESQGKPDAYSSWALVQYADALHLPQADFKAGLKDAELLGEIERDAQKARQLGIHERLPFFLVCGNDFCANGGYALSGGQPSRAFEKRVRLVLAAKGGPLPTTPL
jgi:serine/threonine protein kinase/protein-disulfide isomerase